MRSVRTVVGLAALVCALFAFASVASAKKTPTEKPFFGEFVASRVSGPITEASPAHFKGTGEIDEFTNIGGFKLQECTMKASGNVTQERSTKFFTSLAIKCSTFLTPEGEGKTKIKKTVKFHLGVEFKANHSAEVGQPNEGEFNIVEGSGVIAKISSTKCKVEIPAQAVPIKAGQDPEEFSEFEAVPEIETEEEEVEGGKLKTFPSGFHDTLFIFWEFHKIKSKLIVDGEACQHPEGGKILENGDVEYGNGTFEGELEEVGIKKGNLAFVEEKGEEI
jgi:hypothetical protein